MRDVDAGQPEVTRLAGRAARPRRGSVPELAMSNRRYSLSKPSRHASRSCSAGLSELSMPAPISPARYRCLVFTRQLSSMDELVRYMPAGTGQRHALRCPHMAKAAAPDRRRDADRTRQEILDVATREFADRGFAGGRVDEIAEQHAHDEADDLLLLRQQGAAVRGGARARLCGDPRGRADDRRRSPRSGRRDPPARRADVRPPGVASGLQPPGGDREHPPRRAHRRARRLRRPEQRRDRADRADPPSAVSATGRSAARSTPSTCT